MVAVKTQQASQFMKAPPVNIGAVLFYGSDPGLVSERSAQLAKLLAARENPAGEILRIDDNDLENDSGRLSIELNTKPMFSGRNIVRATAGRRISTLLLKPLLSEGALEGFLIVEAGNLKPDDGMRSLFEGLPNAAAVACYPDDDANLESLVNDVLRQFGMKIEPDTRDVLVSRLGADRALSRAEIEKLALYCMGRDMVTIDDIEAIVGDAADLALEKIPEAAALGNATRAISDYGRAIASGESAQAIILITQRYFLRLHRVRADIDSGRSFDEAVRGLRPPLHFKAKDAFAAQCRTWTRKGLDQALKRIAETAKTARLNSNLEEILGERLVLALSAMTASSQSAARRR